MDIEETPQVRPTISNIVGELLFSAATLMIHSAAESFSWLVRLQADNQPVTPKSALPKKSKKITPQTMMAKKGKKSRR